MKKTSFSLRQLSIFLGLVIIFGSFAAARALSRQKAPPQRKPDFVQARLVDTLHVRNADVPIALEIQGQLVAFDKIDLFAEVSGLLISSSRPFKEGSYFPQGSVLIRIDDEEARLTLLSQKSSLLNALTQAMPDLKSDHPASYPQWRAYLDQFEPEKPLPPFPRPLSQEEKHFIASRNLLSQYYNIKSAEERLGKYVLTAPFGGVLTQTAINPGAVVRSGQKLGELMNTSSYELEASVALRDLKYVKVGNPVKLFSDDVAGQWQGRVKRVSDQVNPSTQTVKVFVSVSGQELREGMYLRGEVEGSRIEQAVRLPRSLLAAPEQVYVWRDSSLVLQPVQVAKLTSEFAVVRGLPDGTPILAQMLPGLFDGMKASAKGSGPTPDRSELSNN
jgi:membrane fusion protein, multidrug efflux system